MQVLDNALSGEKYGDYITEGAVVSCDLHIDHVIVMCSKGYSQEVDSLRAKILDNSQRTNKLVADLQESLSVPRVAIAPHKSFFRVLEVTKTHTAKVEKHPHLIRQEL